MDIDVLVKVADSFYNKIAQLPDISQDTSLVDTIKKIVGPKILADAEQVLNTKAISSIPIAINYNKPQAIFEIYSVGNDADEVNQSLKNLLDKKYGPTISKIISSKDKNTQSFRFNLFTVE